MVRRSLLLTTLCLFVLPALVAEYVVQVDAVVGFNGSFKAGRWTPVRITAQNLGDDILGTLELSVQRGDRFGPNQTQTDYVRRLDLTSGSTKEFLFVLPLATTVYPIRVRITHGDQAVYSAERELSGLSARGELILVLARRPNLDFLLPLFNSREERNLDVVYPLPEYLPQQAEGYQAIDLMVIHDARIQTITEQQMKALRTWVASGGRLIISGGAHFGTADARSLASIVELSVGEIGTTGPGQLGLEQLGVTIQGSEADAQIVATDFGEHGTKVHVAPLGRGQVVVLPFDYAQMVRVAPYTSATLWSVLLAGTHPEPLTIGVRRNVFETEILSNQLSLPFYSFPSRALVLGLLISFVFAAATALYWTMARATSNRSVLVLPAIAALGIIVALVGNVALTQRGQPTEALLVTVERAELGPADGFAQVAHEVVLFSRQRAEYAVRMTGLPLVVPMIDRDQRFVVDGSDVVAEVVVDRWGHQNIYATSIVEFPLTAGVQVGVGYVNVELTNATSHTVLDTVILRDGFPESIGTLVPGAQEEHVALAQASGNWNEINWSQFVPAGPMNAHQAQLLRDVARSQREPEAGDRRELLVVGWMSTPLLHSSVTPEFSNRVSLYMVAMRIPTLELLPEEVE